MSAISLERALADEKRCAPAQLALVWVLAQGDDIVPIPGTKRRTYLEDNLGALDVALSDADLARIDAIMPLGAATALATPSGKCPRLRSPALMKSAT